MYYIAISVLQDVIFPGEWRHPPVKPAIGREIIQSEK
jgi:hypothetical protein